MKRKPVIPILLLCIFLLTLPAAAAEDNFPEIQFAAAGSGHTHLPATDLQTKNINELLGAKNIQEIGKQHAVRITLEKQNEIIHAVPQRDNETGTATPTATPTKTAPPQPTPGSKTGRDGIHGATMASAEFNEDSEEKRPTVQVGDPFTEKLLIEACLELMATDTIVAIQDMGAAGLTSSSFEMASKGGLGVTLDLDKVPMREENMSAYDIMLSESQERMLMILKPGKEAVAKAIMDKWELDFAVIGTLTDTGRMVLTRHGEVVADLPIDPRAQAAPEYDRPWVEPTKAPVLPLADVPEHPVMDALRTLIGCPDLASKRWIYQQYDHQVMNDTVQKPGGDAAVVRVHGTGKAVAITTDCTPRYCQADPYEGGRQAVAEAWRNLCAVGAVPLAVTDNLNFGNPQKPEVMGQIVMAIKGMGKACTELDFPVVSGNVSLYNETNGEAIQPTPAIGAVGLLDDVTQQMTLDLKQAGNALVLLGETKGWLGASLYLREVCGREEGAPPPVALHRERRAGELVRQLIGDGLIRSCHDVSDGGLLVAVTDMALASASGLGASLDAPPSNLPLHAWCFGEDQGRYVLEVTPDLLSSVLEEASTHEVAARVIGTVGGSMIGVAGQGVSVAELKAINEAWLPTYMGAEIAQH
ncbi:MAG: phosphoribosylformylglycinamidine synthase subunit PurL [Methanocorpusculum sp.]|nr:phosphoribosylformylglycinamidine synthase subunit PurL [Methanocorpusculum sp.]